MKNLIFASLVVTCLHLPSAEAMKPAVNKIDSIPWDVVKTLAADEEKRREVELQLAPIKSQADLESYLTSRKQTPDPLRKLSQDAQKRFFSSLAFNENGLVGYDYSDLRAELSASEIYGILSLFGAQRTTPLIEGARIMNEADKAIMESEGSVTGQLYPDYGGYRCEGRATCGENVHTICMSGC